MLSVDQALELVLAHAEPTGAARVDVLDALGLTLAEDVVSDVDSPPHDKALMDGYAVIAADVQRDPCELEVLEEVTAGGMPTHALKPGAATRIMTGAPLPVGADAVVMIERTELVDGRVKISNARVAPGSNILRRAESFARGQTVLRAGAEVRPIEIGVLCEVGRTHVSVRRRPQVAVMTSGNELVTPDQVPGPGQIRNSNNAMLVALARRAGAEAIDLGIARDEAEAIRRLVLRGLEYDVLLLSGGVSAGVLDLIPQVLASCGITQVFHKVNLKPGKPLWFGTLTRSASEAESHKRPYAADEGVIRAMAPTLPNSSSLALRVSVFGLPGNPVGSLVCFELFARPAIAKMLGRADGGLPRRTAHLASAFTHRGDRPTYFPAKLESSAPRDIPHVAPLPWRGSADLASVAAANALIHFPPGDRAYGAGEQVDVLIV